MTQAGQSSKLIDPGTPMQKVIPPRLVEPYLTGQRSVIVGYVYRGGDCPDGGPADLYAPLGLGFDGSEFTPDSDEIFVLRWRALDMSASLVSPPAEEKVPGLPEETVTAFYTLPVPVPVGTEMYRITAAAAEYMARYDGQTWLRPPSRGL